MVARVIHSHKFDYIPIVVCTTQRHFQQNLELKKMFYKDSQGSSRFWEKVQYEGGGLPQANVIRNKCRRDANCCKKDWITFYG